MNLFKLLPLELSITISDNLSIRDLENLACCDKDTNKVVRSHWHIKLKDCGEACDCFKRRYEYLDKTFPLICIDCGVVYSHAGEYNWDMCEPCFFVNFNSIVTFNDDFCVIL